MNLREGSSLALIITALAGLPRPACAQSVSDFAVLVSSIVQTNPAQIQLAWPKDPNATSYTVRRKLRDDSSWGTGITLPGSATNYLDTNVVVGGAYEYDVSKSATTYSGEGYIYSGVQVPLVDSRGKVVLIVDNTFSASLSNELSRLQLDLTGDGWTVLRHDVPRMSVDPANTNSSVWAARSNEIANIKGLIKADYIADSNNVKAVFLFGHVPVPYSGKIGPDGHPDHLGAWPADMFYGDMTGAWTDSIWNTTTAASTRNWNVPGDGKFDQALLPGTMALQVGRVDLATLPSFSQSETELMRAYLNKDHNFRLRFINAQRRGWIDDHFGVSGAGAPVAVNGWRNFAPFFGPGNTFSGSDWFGTLSTNSYLWGYGCGAGNFTSCSGVGGATDCAANDPQIVFTMFFGSYFGDWDSQDNFLRASIATRSYTLTSAWVGRPYWQFHHMALGETIGFSTCVSQNNDGTLYDVNSDGRSPHIALMGDPTLRLHIVAPPSALVISTNQGGGLNLTWRASLDTVAGYYVYRAPTIFGPFVRLNASLIAATSYMDPAATTTNIYMVRAVKLELSGSGTYWNASQGIFQNLNGTAGAPIINLLQPTNNAPFGLHPTIPLSANLFDPANAVTNIAFYSDGVKIGETNAPPYNLVWVSVPGGSHVVSARATSSSGRAYDSNTVTIRVDNGGSPRLSIMPIGNNSYSIQGDDVVGRTYHIQFLGDVNSTNWQPLGTATATPAGFFRFTNTSAAPRGFYRSVYP
jgi:hypothetical protein